MMYFQVAQQRLTQYTTTLMLDHFSQKHILTSRTWVTNSPQLRAITQQEQTDNSDVPSNVLGLLWNPISDELTLVPKRPFPLRSPAILLLALCPVAHPNLCVVSTPSVSGSWLNGDWCCDTNWVKQL